MLPTHDYKKYGGPPHAENTPLRERALDFLHIIEQRDQDVAAERAALDRQEAHNAFAEWMQIFGIGTTDEEIAEQAHAKTVEGFRFRVERGSGRPRYRLLVSRACHYCGADKIVATYSETPTRTYPYDHLVQLGQAVRADNIEAAKAAAWREGQAPGIDYPPPCDCRKDD